MNIAKWGVIAQKYSKDNAPLLLTGAAIGGVIFTTYQTATASLKAAKILEDAAFVRKNESGFTPHGVLSKTEKVKLVWKLYVLPATSLTATIASMVFAHRISAKRLAGLAVAYSLTEKNLKEYEDKIKEKFGIGKEQQARDELAQDRFKRDEPDEAQAQQILVINSSDMLCQDMFSGRMFKCDMETLRRAENDVNARVISNMFASLSDFYECIGLPATSFSDEVGFNMSNKCILRFSSVLTQDGKPALSFDFKTFPIRNFDYANASDSEMGNLRAL